MPERILLDNPGFLGDLGEKEGAEILSSYMGGSAVFIATNSSYNSSFSFRGTSLSLFGTRVALPTDEPARIAIDGGKLTKFQQTDPNLEAYLIYTSPQLADTSHTIEVSNPGTFIDIDYATVEFGSDTPLSGTRLIVDDSDPSIKYSGPWSQNSSTIDSLNSLAPPPATAENPTDQGVVIVEYSLDSEQHNWVCLLSEQKTSTSGGLPTETPRPPNPPKSHGVPRGVILGTTFGALVGISVVIILMVCLCRRRRLRQQTSLETELVLSDMAMEHKSAISTTTPQPIEGHYVLSNHDIIHDVETHWSFRRFIRFYQTRGLPRVVPFRGISYPVTTNTQGPQHKQPPLATSPRIVVPQIAVRGQEVDTTSILSATVVAAEGVEDPRSRIDHLRHLMVEFQREIDQAEPPRSV
ncbi:hypothetical protein DXG01_000698 [Tephrocybe rancida]|nr:hypothetical protein DXG01_000698 [Tephrocybe rancida]